MLESLLLEEFVVFVEFGILLVIVFRGGSFGPPFIKRRSLNLRSKSANLSDWHDLARFVRPKAKPVARRNAYLDIIR